MGNFATAIASAWRAFNIDGDASSGARKPSKAEIRALGPVAEQQFQPFGLPAMKGFSDALAAALAGGTLLVHWYGDSLTEGYRAGGAGGVVNSGLATSTIRPPDRLQAALAYAFSGIATVTVQNFGVAGQTTKQGYDTWGPSGGAGLQAGRWALAQVAPNISILMYGYNDANGYGGTTSSISESRDYISRWCARELARGSYPIVLIPPHIQEVAADRTLQPYREAHRQVAVERSLVNVDMDDQISWMGAARWSDGVHLSDIGYNELGWHLAALFSSKAGAALPHVAGGSQLTPYTNGLDGGVLFTFAGARDGALRTIATTKTLGVGVYCEADVYPEVTTYNAGGTVRDMTIYYAGAGSGVPNLAIKSPGTGNKRSKVLGQRLPRGYRYMTILNDASPAADAFFEGLKFKAPNRATASPFSGDRATCVGGVASKMGETGDWCFIDYEAKTYAGWEVEFRGTIPDDGNVGLVMAFDQDQSLKSGSANQLMVLRSATTPSTLILRTRVNGVDTDVTDPSFFPASGDYVGVLKIVANAVSGAYGVYRNAGAGGPLGSGSSILPIYPGIVVLGGSAKGIQCASLIVRET